MPIWKEFSYTKWQKSVQAISIFTVTVLTGNSMCNWAYMGQHTVVAKVVSPQQEPWQLQSEYHLSG